ncbi:MAG: hypothetical protein MRY59_04605 [Aquisalinus sp.]|nr:hypothetical protein [Aquisalinus sp.]
MFPVLIAIVLMQTASADADPVLYCGEPENAAVEAAIRDAEEQISLGDGLKAIAAAERALDADESCIAAHMAMLDAIQLRFEEVGGMKALPLAGKYRRSLAKALEVDPDNVEIRSREIGFLINAPGIAGGSKRKAKQRIDDLRKLDAIAAADMTVMLAKSNDDNNEIIEALAAYVALSPDDQGARIEHVIFLREAGRYREADEKIVEYATIPGDDFYRLALLFLRGTVRVLGEYELVEAEEFFQQYIDEIESVDNQSLPDKARTLAYIGESRQLRGDKEGAIQAYEAAITLNPEEQKAVNGLKSLR